MASEIQVDDRNKDGKTDVWSYVNEKGFSKKIEFDDDFDGKVDKIYFLYYDRQDNLIKIECDSNNDGEIDEKTTYFKDCTAIAERDENYNGIYETKWYFIYSREAGPEPITRAEQDRNEDGKVDFWKYIEENKVVGWAEDRNYDGTTDLWVTNVHDEKGKVIKWLADYNNNGVIDEVRTLVETKEGIKQECDKKNDGRVDFIITPIKDENSKWIGDAIDSNLDSRTDIWEYRTPFDVLTRKEIDTNFDSKIDKWCYYKKGIPKKAYIDFNFDGTIDSSVYFKDIISFKQYIDRGSDYLKKGIIDKAIDSYQKAILINPQNGHAYYNLGLAYTKKDMYDEAIRECKNAIVRVPDYHKAYTNLGILFGKIGKPDEGESNFKKAIEINNKDYIAHNGLALIYIKKNMVNEALTELKKTIEINPKYAEGYYNLGCLFSLQNKKGDAIRNLSKAIDLGFNDLDIINEDRDLDNIRNTPQFIKLLNKIKIRGRHIDK